MKLDVLDREGKKVKSIDVDDQVFGVKPHRSLVHQAMLAQRANLHRGTHKTKSRGEVRGSTAKLFRQKGTGRARAGSIRSPIRRGGGVAFGPRPRSYHQDLPKRMRRLALRSVLSAKAANGTLRVIDALVIETPRTKELRTLLDVFGFERSTLVVTGQPSVGIKHSVRNLQKVKWLPAAYLNVLDLLSHRSLLMTEDAVHVAEAVWGGERATKRRAPIPEVAANG
ncbi:MAG: 50S ribosomal protein L4 [Chloroflexi bacterium]|nr:50S ribosomal protein L4 [Chloroflexota bacterium]